MEPAIQIRELRVVFPSRKGPVTALDGLSLDVGRGQVLGFIGPNGAGKTTTMNVLLGFLDPTAGEARIFGEDVRRSIARERIGYLPERPDTYRFLTGRELLRMTGCLFRIGGSALAARIAEVLASLGMEAAADRRIGTYSQGMVQRICLAQALINDPDLVILDEPTSGLDPIGCREVKDLILALARRGKTVILSSHLLSDVEDVCDRVVIYYGGKIQAMGTLKELLATPDAIRITTPALPRETMERVLEIIRKDVAADKVRIDTPTQNLESYFLDVVQKARSAAAETSGAMSGARVAAYLRAGIEEKPPGEKILERLAAPQVAQPVAPPQSPERVAKPALDDKRLEALTRATEPVVTPARPATGEKPVDLSTANEKLSSLLGKPK